MTACMRTTNLVYIHGLKITSQLSRYKPNQNTGTKGDGHPSSVSKQNARLLRYTLKSEVSFFIGSSCTDCILDMFRLGEPKMYHHETEGTT